MPSGITTPDERGLTDLLDEDSTSIASFVLLTIWVSEPRLHDHPPHSSLWVSPCASVLSFHLDYEVLDGWTQLSDHCGMLALFKTSTKRP